MTYRCSKLMILACLVVEIIQHRMFAFADPLYGRCHVAKDEINVPIALSAFRDKSQCHRNEHEHIYAIHRSTVMPSLNVIA